MELLNAAGSREDLPREWLSLFYRFRSWVSEKGEKLHGDVVFEG